MHDTNTNGMHTKVRTADDYVNVWFQIIILNISIDLMEVYITALSTTEKNAYCTYFANLETRGNLVYNQCDDRK